jgi:hypothetical protein
MSNGQCKNIFNDITFQSTRILEFMKRKFKKGHNIKSRCKKGNENSLYYYESEIAGI